MSVADHLRIRQEEYDERIRTFVPYYETMVHLIADALATVRGPDPDIVDLGIGTGALAEQCLRTHPKARMTGIDVDASMMDMARRRLQDHPSVEYLQGDFLDMDLPAADAYVACISLHHIVTPLQKQRFYERVYAALHKGGILLSGDCFPGVEPSLARRHRLAWLQHLQQRYSPSESEGYLQSWSGEDVYFPLEDELGWLRAAGFRPEVIWRKDGFAVIAGYRER